MSVGFIGAGKVGCSLGRHLANHGVHISGYISSEASDAAWAAEHTESVAFSSVPELFAASDVVLITVPDDVIATAWDDARAELDSTSAHGKIVGHCSGSLASSVLVGVLERGMMACSVHPLCAVSDKATSHETLARAVFTLEGDVRAVDAIGGLLDACGNAHHVILAEDKPVYHAAAVFASNLVVALADESIELLCSCGFDRDSAWQALQPLFAGNCEAVAAKGPDAALTGPIERDDVDTVRHHLDALEGDARAAYKALSLALIPVAQRRHPERDYKTMRLLLLEREEEL